VKWNLICQPKLQGGLAAQNLDIQKQMFDEQMAS